MAFYRINPNKLKCPTCRKKVQKALSIEGSESEFWYRCSNLSCKTFINTFIPQEHQYIFLKDPTQQIGLFGGYGSGKTSANIQDQEKHILITPKGQSLVGAKIMPQLEQTFKLEFEKDFPIEFVQHINKQKNHIDFVNGHRLLWRPLYDNEMIRSLNLSSAKLVEASAINFEIYVQLQARMRNVHALRFHKDEEGNIIFNEDGTPMIKYDWTKMVTETNPGPGWVRDEFLLTSHKIHLHDPEIHNQKYHVPHPDIDKSTHIIPTKANKFLPPNFVQRLKQGRPNWWVRRYIEGSFDYSEGLVYPEASRSFIKPYTIPTHCLHLVGMDYGINDKTHFLFAALNLKEHKITFYHEVVVSGMNVKSISNTYKEDLYRIVPLARLYTTPVADARSLSKRQSHDVNKTLGDLFLEEGLLFKPAKMDKNARMLRTNTFFELGQIEIFDTLVHLRKELENYKFPERSLDDKKAPDKPEDKNDHGVSAMEFIIMELPPNLRQLTYSAIDESGRAMIGQARQESREYYDPFTDTSQNQTSNPYYDSIY